MRNDILISFLFIPCYILCSCSLASKKAELTIINSSNKTIDSVVFPWSKIKYEDAIPAHTKKTLVFEMPESFGFEDGIGVYIYTKKKKYDVGIGFCDGNCYLINSKIYVYDQGISYNDTLFSKPPNFILNIYNKSTYSADSIIPSGRIISKRNMSGGYEYLLDYESFEKEPFLRIYQHGKKYYSKVDHDWDDWVNHVESVIVYNNGEFLNSQQERDKWIKKKESNNLICFLN